ncbi:hypothetical protein [Lysinibacillus fusiformis]|uniref:hypothetical protein n=1 Tax=Lysinibacillus fusiformis TaxID=28031 RepID=UPI00263B2230|nr:hypothetical protein [Lysinibacillus fusiformis]MDC6267362.1 hypothetical protein [Lysinibacillus sphaericus]MDN4968204.1 hypothetical protein [Lysinibacillus fusiformis]MDN4968378.1 hypothetical protein [Lysinibacillus fusiformis]
MNTLITSIKLIAKGDIPSQVELLGKPIYVIGKLKSFETIYQEYNYDEENSLDCSVENFNMSVSSLPDCTYKFTNYYKFNVLSKGELEFDLCVLIENVPDDLINNIDTLVTPSNIIIDKFMFKDDCYLFDSCMSVIEILGVEIIDIY